MKRDAQKAIGIALVVTLLGVLALVGCTQEEGQQQPDEQQQEQQQQQEAVELQVFAANSLSAAMAEVQEAYMQSHEGITFADTQFLSSGELNEQLAAGGYADILISASEGKMKDAVEAGLVDEATRITMFKNDLVMVTAEGSSIQPCTLEDIATGMYTVSVGDESVPAGNYACQSLYTVECYSDPSGIGGEFINALAEPGRVILNSSVGNVARTAETGDVDIAFVYSSDVYRFDGLRVAGIVPADTHKNILYPAAVTAQSDHPQEAADFIQWCISDQEAIKIWQSWGFELVS